MTKEIMRSIDRVLDHLSKRGCNPLPKNDGRYYLAHCPAHDDQHPSLKVEEAPDGKVLLKCFAGCSAKQIVRALGLEMDDLFPAKPSKPRPLKRSDDVKTTIYEIRDEHGDLRAIHKRLDMADGSKRFHWITPDGEISRGHIKATELPLYGIHKLDGCGFVIVTEGEKAAEALWGVGIPAVGTVCGAASTPCDDALKPLLGVAPVYLWPDADEAGRDHMERIAHRLHTLGHKDVRLILWPQARQGDDAADLIAGSGSEAREKIQDLLQQAKPWQPAISPASFPLTDAGNAELIAHIAGDRIRYDHQRQRWLVWNGTHWIPDADGEVDRIALDAARHRLRAAADIPDASERQAAARWALQSESAYRRKAALEWARSLRPIADRGEGWDADPWLLGVPNGVVDLRTGELREGRPADKITLIAGAPFDPHAQCPRWEAFLREIFLDNQALIDFIHRAVGYSLTGLTTEQCLFLCYGTGANGKSTFLAALRHVLGDYAANTPFQTFEEIRTNSASNDVAALYGKRLVTSAEAKERARLNEARIKVMTGGDPITCRFLFREFFTYTPVLKLWLAVNHKPTVTDESHGFWRRIRLIPFNARFDGSKADPTLLEKLKAEASGILTWAVRGCLAWQSDGLKTPKVVTEATEEYRAESDFIGGFIKERCLIDPAVRCRAKELYEAYLEWARENGADELTATVFGRRITERGFRKVHTREGKLYEGIGLLTEHPLDMP